jgi:hypothetical protein
MQLDELPLKGLDPEAGPGNDPAVGAPQQLIFRKNVLRAIETLQWEGRQGHDPVDIAGRHCNCEIRVGSEGNARVLKSIAQNSERRERENDISQRPRMEDQNLHYSMTIAFRLF